VELNDAKAGGLARTLAMRALRDAGLHLPFLSGLAALARVREDRRVQTAGIFASGLILVNPEWFPSLSREDRLFVMAHELMHLCLMTHRRMTGELAKEWNWAHDYIINEMLVKELGLAVPWGALFMPGAMDLSGEQLVARLRSDRSLRPGPSPYMTLGQLLAEAGLVAGNRVQRPPESLPLSGDALDDAKEREWFSEAGHSTGMRREAERAALEAASFRIFQEGLACGGTGKGSDPGTAETSMEAVRAACAPPWERAVQRWFDGLERAGKTYGRSSRRMAAHPDTVPPGVCRDGWILNVILDTSGSMVEYLGHMLGAIASFAEAANVGQVRLLQCDTAVTADETVATCELGSHQIRGLGGSDMGPAIRLLSEDPSTSGAVVLTDGMIDFPADPPPYEVLWFGPLEHSHFPYGEVIPFNPRYSGW